MLKAVTSGVALALGLTAAPSFAQMPPPPPMAFNYWTGCHVGVNGGWAHDSETHQLAPTGTYLTPPGAAAPPNPAGTGDFATDVAALTTSTKVSDSGFIGGGQIGCDTTLGPSGAFPLSPLFGAPVVIGFEGDFDGSTLSNKSSQNFAAFTNIGNPAFTDAARTQTVSDSLNWVTSFRGRVGLAWNQLLLYGTGGIALANYSAASTVSFGTVAVAGVYSGALHIGTASSTRAGAVFGGGAEYAFGNNWSLRGEYLVYDFGSTSVVSPLVSPAGNAPGYAWTTKISSRSPQVFRVGLNFKFN